MVNFKYGGPPLSEQDIRDYERQIRRRFPSTYRQFMLRQNGGCPSPNLYPGADGITRLVMQLYPLGGPQMRAQEHRFLGPVWAIGDNTGGNYYLLHLRKGTILHFDHDLHDDETHPDLLFELAPDIDALIAGLTGEEEKEEPFSEQRKMAASGTADGLDELLSRYELDYSENEYGWTLLRWAIFYKNWPLVRACLARGASLGGAMSAAVMSKDKDMVEYLLSLGVDINQIHGNKTPITSLIDRFDEFEGFLESKGAKWRV